jgi:hypothetical protein
MLGNGLNRLSSQLDWSGLLKRLANELGVAEPKCVEQKPLSLLFEELCAGQGGVFRQAEAAVKKQIASLLASVQSDCLHAAFASRVEVILTTNYDYAIEHAMNGPLFEPAPVYPESRFNLFRRVRVGAKEVWHVHGILDMPGTIVLGYDQYSGYLQRIRMYLTHGLKPEGKRQPMRSPLKSGMQNFEEWPIHSWVDHFLRDHLHIVGLGLDFTEIDLWWLLLHKRRRVIQTGRTFYYDIRVPECSHSREPPQLSVLRSLGMTVVTVHGDSYREGYERVLEEVSRNISAHPTLLESGPLFNYGRNAGEGAMPMVDESEAGGQLKLDFKRKVRRTRQRR